MELRTLMAFCFAILVGAAQAGPISWDDSKCAQKCSSQQHKFNYEPRKTYVYSYESSSEVQLTDSSGDKAEVDMTATVEIGVLGDCEMLLQLRDVSLTNSESSSFVVFKSALEKHPMAFALQDGVVTSVCPAPEDKNSPFVVNIKRAILSALQHTAKDLESEDTVKETDISGVCEAHYKPSKGWGSAITVVKTKDLKSCSRRVNTPVSTFATPYSAVESAVQGLPLVGGEQRCEQVINEGIVKSVKCTESNVFRPLASQGMAVESEISLAHIDTKDGVRFPSQRIGDRSNLLFAPNPKASEESNERDARHILSELCQSVKEGVTPKTPFRVGQLKEVLQGLPEDRIARIYSSLESNQLCASQIVQDIFVDSLVMAGTKGPVKFMAKMVQQEKVSHPRAQAWFTMLSFNQNAEPESIQALVPFLKDPSIGGRHSILGISAFIYNFCDDDEQKQECREVPAVKEALSALKEQLASGCQVSGEEEENLVVLALMAFENIGRVGPAKDTIKQCIAQKQNSNVIRHAAIRAFRRVPCDPEVASHMLRVYKDQAEDAEVRIYAYYGAMRCASPAIVHEVKAVLEKESINQVAAFVWSHLTNMQETSAPLKQELRSIISDVSLQKKFSTDLRKYSRFIEWSAFSERLNVGADAEIAIVRSPKSFLPRSGFFNISTQLFGESVPVLEIGGHMQGLESYAERYFGDQGILSNLKIEDLLQALGLSDKDNNEDEENEIESGRRNTRSIKKFDKLNLLKERASIRSTDEPKASAYLSILGRHMTRVTSQDAKEFLSMKEAFDIMEILTQLAQKQKFERSMSVQFLDAELVIPSISGMKLALSVNGTLSAAVKVDGKFDVRRLFTKEHNADIEGYLNPSATIEIVAIMSVDSGVHRPGLKGVFNFHSSQNIEGKLQIKQGRVIDAQMNLPKEKLELLTVTSNLYNVEKNGNEKPIRSKKYYDIAGCTKQLNKPLGIEFCSKMHVPKPFITEDAPYLMALTDASIQITLKKTDSSMRGYSFHLELPSPHSHDTFIYQLEVDTPGSKINRHFELEAKLSSRDNEHSANWKINSPFKKLQGSALLVDRPELKKATAQISLGDSKKYSLESEVKIQKQSGQVQLQPSVVISWPHAQPFTFGGSVVYSLGRKQQMSVDLQANRPTNKPSFLRGTIVKDGDFTVENPQGRLRLSSDITLSAPFLESRLHGSVDKSEGVIATDVAVDYKLPRTSRHTAKLVSKIQNLSTRGLTKITTLTQITSTQFPEENARLAWNIQHKPMEHFENEITLAYGEDLESKESQIHLLQVSKLEGVDKRARRGKSLNRILLEAPFLDNEFDSNIRTEWDLEDKPRFNVKAEAKYAPNKKLEGSFDYSYKSSKPIEMHIEAMLKTPQREMIYQDNLRERSPNEFEGKTMIQWQKGQRATIDYLYRMKSDADKTHHEVELKMATPSMKVPMQHRGLYRVTRDTVNVNSHTQYQGKPVYSVEAHMAREGESKIEVQLSEWKGEVHFQNEAESKKLSLEVENEAEDVHVEGEAHYTAEPRGAKHALDVKASWKPEDPASSFEFNSAIIKKSSRKPVKYDVVSSFKSGRFYQAKIEGEVAADLIQGPHDLTMEMSSKRVQPISVNVKHVIENDNMNCEFHYSINNEEKLQAIASGKYVQEGSELEASWGIALKSPYRKFNGKEFHVSYKQEEDSPKYIANIRAQNAPGKPYNLNVEYVRDDTRAVKKGRAHVILTTPIPEYRSQEATISGEHSRKGLKVNFDCASAKGNRVQADLDIQQQGDKATGSLEVKTPLRNLRSVALNAVADYSDGYASESTVEINGEKKGEWKLQFNQGRDFNAHFQGMIALDETYEAKVDAIVDDKKQSWEHSVSRDGAEFSSSNLLFAKQGKNYNGHIIMKNGEWVGAVEMKNINNSPKDRVYHLSTRGLGEPLTLTAKLQHEGKEFTPELTICAASAPSECLEVKAVYRNKDKPYSREMDREVELKITQGSDLDISIELAHQQDKDSFSQKMEVEAWGKELGYEVELEDKDEKNTALLRIKLPSRQMLAQAALEKKDDKYELEAEILADEKRHPERKLVIVGSHQSSEHDGADVLHSAVEISHPSFQRPIKLDFEMQSREGDVLRPLEAKMGIDVASDPKKKIMIQAYLEKPNKDDSNITSFFNIYQADRQDLDIMLKGHLGKREHRVTLGHGWHWINKGQKYEGSTFALIDKSEEEVHIYSQIPNHRFEAHGDWEYRKKQVFSLDINSKLDENEGSAKLAVDLTKPCGELIFSSQPGTVASRYHMCIDSEGKSLLTITAESYEGTEKQTDATIVFDRRSGKTLNAHIHWRPEKLGELMYQMMELSEKTDFEIGAEKYLKHAANKLEIVAEEFNKVVAKPFSQYAIKEARAISRELSADFDHVGDALNRWQSHMPSWDEIEKYLEEVIPEPVQRYIEKIYHYIAKKIGSMTPFSCDYGSVCYKVKYAYNRHGLEGLMEYVYSAVENMPSGYYKAVVAFKDFVLSKIELPSWNWEPIKEVYEDVVEWVQEVVEPIMNSEIVEKVQEFLVEWKEYASAVIEEVVEELSTRLEQLSETIMETPEARALIQTIKSVLEQIVKEFDNLNLDETAKKVLDYSKDFLSAEALKDSVRVITLDPENGNIQVEIRLPADANTLRQKLQSIKIPQDTQFAGFGAPVKEVSKTIHSLNTAAKQDWIPPYKARGQVVAGMHYKTFDNSFYDFAGQCTYLLAHDFVDKNFTVLINYEGQDNKGEIDKSILVIIDDQVIEVDPDDETVTIDDQATELPIILDDVTITRQGHTIVVDSRRGLSVTCNLVHDFCSTSISGWYYGKTAGLFGTYDNEASNDYTKPRGQIEGNPKNFARSWEAASGCKARNLARDIEIDIEAPKFERCRSLFRDEESPLSDCFGEVDEKEYLRMCARQVAVQRNPEEAACAIAAAYVDICQDSKVDVSLPQSCTKCQSIHGSQLDFGEKKHYKESPQSADVVFIIEERPCNRPIVKDMDSIARLLDRELLNSGYSANRFGIVAFGGQQEEKRAHSHTARGKLFFDSKDLVLATEKINYNSKKGPSDAFSAIQFAIRYPFRAGVSKTFVLLTCSQCEESNMKVDYSSIQNMLLEHGIILHTLSPRDIQVRGSGSKSKGIYGVDSNTVFRSKDVSQKELEGTPDLRAQVAVPKDMCVALAQEVHGSFFTTKPIIESSSESKNWKSLLARRVALTAEPHQCQQCDCGVSKDQVPVTVCKPCRALSPKRPLKSYQEDQYDENDDE